MSFRIEEKQTDRGREVIYYGNIEKYPIKRIIDDVVIDTRKREYSKEDKLVLELQADKSLVERELSEYIDSCTDISLRRNIMSLLIGAVGGMSAPAMYTMGLDLVGKVIFSISCGIAIGGVLLDYGEFLDRVERLGILRRFEIRTKEGKLEEELYKDEINRIIKKISEALNVNHPGGP